VYLTSMCYDWVHKTAPGELQRMVDFVAEATGFCDHDKPNVADGSLLPGYCDKGDYPHGLKPLCLGEPIYSVAKDKMNSRLCGFSPVGLLTRYGVALEIFANLVNYGEPNDGLVPASSCTMGSDTLFTESALSNYYRANVNHADSTCRDGDASDGDPSKQPCLFYKFRK